MLNVNVTNSSFENAIARTKDWVLAELNAMLVASPALQQEVVGIEYSHWGFPSPIDLQNLLSQKFNRTFHPILASAIEEIRSDSLKKEEFHQFLLNKYLGINVADWEVRTEDSFQPNAFYSLPNTESDDSFLHLYFLQPFRLFNINPDNRNYCNRHTANANREWLWFSDAGYDSAPIWRRIIQLYVVSAILEDYVDNDNEFRDENIACRLEQLDELRNTLKAKIVQKINQAGTFSLAGQQVRGNPTGLLGNGAQLLSASAMPDLMDIASFYPIGRLMLGQPRTEPHHLVAANAVRENVNPIFKAIKYSCYWLFTHLNFSTSMFWIKLCFSRLRDMLQALKNYITQPNVGLNVLFIQSLLLIPGMFILAASPLLVMLPWVYGLTSIPFSLLRSFCLNGRYDQLRGFTTLRIIDVTELTKDVILFFMFVMPIFDFILAWAVSLIPVPILAAGSVISFILLAVAYFICSEGDMHWRWVEDLTALSQINFMQFFSSSLVIGMGIYIGIGAAGRQIYPNLPTLPERLRGWLNVISERLSLLDNNLLAATRYQQFFNADKIIPAELRQKTIEPPKETLIRLSNEMERTRATLQRQLGQLMRLPNIMSEPLHQNLIRNVMRSLAIKPETTREGLGLAISKAQEILNNNLSTDEKVHLLDLIDKLKLGEQYHFDVVAIRNTMGVGYQPTWKLLNGIRDRISADDNPELLAKCDNILKQQQPTCAM